MQASRNIIFSLLALAVATPLMAQPLEDLRNIHQLRARFNEETGIPRLVLLMSPTCPVCIAGAEWVQKNVLEPNPEAEIRVFAIWFNMISGDKRSRWPGTILNDPRVVHFWDANRTVGRWYAQDPQVRETSLTDAGVVWDTFFLYGQQAVWESTPSELIDHGSTIMASRQRLGQQLESLWGTGNDSLKDPWGDGEDGLNAALATCQPLTPQRVHHDAPHRSSNAHHSCSQACRH